MELNIYEVIRGPRISDKAQIVNKKQKKLVLEVHLHATKSDIKLAVQRLFNVKVKSVGTLISKSKKSKGVGRRRNTSTGTMQKMKIAYVSLAEGYDLDLFDTTQISLAEVGE